MRIYSELMRDRTGIVGSPPKDQVSGAPAHCRACRRLLQTVFAGPRGDHRCVGGEPFVIDWFNAGRHEDILLQRDAVKHLSAVVLMELRAGAFALRDRRLVQRVESAFARAGRILVPSQAVFVEAGDALRRPQTRALRLAALAQDKRPPA